MAAGLKDLPRPIVYVFGGGGARGAAHAGQMRALRERGHLPDATIGTSIGSITAAMVAEDPSMAVGRLEELWAAIRKGDAFPGSVLGHFSTLSQTKTHIYSSAQLERTIRYSFSAVRFEDLELPFAAVTTDYRRAESYVVSNGALAPALLASAAIPGIFPAVEIDGRLLVDGGVVSNVPVVEAQLLQPGSLVVMDCLGPVYTARRNIVDIVSATAATMQHKQRMADLADVAQRLPVVYLPPPRSVGSPLNFDHAPALMADTYETACAFLDALRLPDGVPPGFYGEVPMAVDENAVAEQPPHDHPAPNPVGMAVSALTAVASAVLPPKVALQRDEPLQALEEPDSPEQEEPDSPEQEEPDSPEQEEESAQQ